MAIFAGKMTPVRGTLLAEQLWHWVVRTERRILTDGLVIC
jgi:hypothetical protein